MLKRGWQRFVLMVSTNAMPEIMRMCAFFGNSLPFRLFHFMNWKIWGARQGACVDLLYIGCKLPTWRKKKHCHDFVWHRLTSWDWPLLGHHWFRASRSFSATSANRHSRLQQLGTKQSHIYMELLPAGFFPTLKGDSTRTLEWRWAGKVRSAEMEGGEKNWIS